MNCIYDFNLNDLKTWLKDQAIKEYRAKQIFNWVYKKKCRNFFQISNLSQKQQEKLNCNFIFSDLSSLKKEKSQDKVEKFLFKLQDGKTIETALIPEVKRNTLCLSTQVGCRFNCSFCASKQGGFIRNLKPQEIVGQYLKLAFDYKITNIVYMGIGEPLDNFENVVKSIEIISEPAGINFTKKRISLSTCGLPDEIKKLAGLKLGIKLSVSLHAVTDIKRSKIMPVNKKYCLDELLKSLHYYRQRQKHNFTFEYILIDGFNTNESDALGLARLIKKTGAKLNLIPHNQPGLNQELENDFPAFCDKLKQEKITFTLRKARGRGINAACGQLRSREDLNE